MRTGVEAATLRMWEARHGFPTPSRTSSGHRRYNDDDVQAIKRVLSRRADGLELRSAIESAQASALSPAASEQDSIYTGLRRRRPEMHPHTLPKHVLLGISHAIEDECGASAHRAVLFASFQRERFYRSAQARWRDLSAPARRAVVLADFARVHAPADGPTEVPVDRSDPAGREWSVICDAPDFTAMLAAWERPGQDDKADPDRNFEVLWSMEPELVRDAALVSCAIASRSAPTVTDGLEQLLSGPVEPAPRMECVTALTNRMVAYVAGARPRTRR